LKMTDHSTLARQADDLQNHRVSARELLLASTDSIDAKDSSIRAFLHHPDREQLLLRAGEIDDARARGLELPKYAGIPIAIKDNIAQRGQPLTCGSKMLEGYCPPYSATSLERLESAGLIVIGKTNMDEFGFGSSTEHSAYFATCNPVDNSRVPGGTSGGSAAAVGAGMVSVALGSDTGGSVRQPASFCGVVGIRPSYGTVSRYGLVAYSSSMDQIGPIARSVRDAWEILRLIAGHDERDSTSVPQDSFAGLDKDTGPIRVGLPRQYLSSSTAPAVLAAVEAMAGIAEGLGYDVAEVDLPTTDVALSAYYLIASVEAASNLARYDGVKFGYRSSRASNYDEMLINTRTEGFGDEAKRRIMLGTFVSSAGYAAKYYEKALRARTLVARDFAKAFRTVDVLLTPVAPTTAWHFGARDSDPLLMYLEDVFTVPASLAGIPGVVLPGGFDADGLPIGIQLLGPYGSDHRTSRIALQLEEASS